MSLVCDSNDGVCSDEDAKEAKPKEVIVQEQLLLTLESAYPNILPVDDLAQYVASDPINLGQIYKISYDL